MNELEYETDPNGWQLSALKRDVLWNDSHPNDVQANVPATHDNSDETYTNDDEVGDPTTQVLSNQTDLIDGHVNSLTIQISHAKVSHHSDKWVKVPETHELSDEKNNKNGHVSVLETRPCRRYGSQFVVVVVRRLGGASRLFWRPKLVSFVDFSGQAVWHKVAIFLTFGASRSRALSDIHWGFLFCGVMYLMLPACACVYASEEIVPCVVRRHTLHLTWYLV